MALTCLVAVMSQKGCDRDYHRGVNNRRPSIVDTSQIPLFSQMQFADKCIHVQWHQRRSRGNVASETGALIPAEVLAPSVALASYLDRVQEITTSFQLCMA